MTVSVKVVADSTCANGVRLTTLQIRYWRAIHGEFMTHRVFSRNASSSRAIPVMTTLRQVWSEPAGPVYWGSNKPGMQAGAELTGFKLKLAKFLWRTSGKVACGLAYLMVKLNLHKQIANRILEPWQYISVVVSATEWPNFFELRDHKDAQPEIKELAIAMREAMAQSVPVLRPATAKNVVGWHLPYIKDEERVQYPIATLCAMSAARCARVSYLTHDGATPDSDKDVALFKRLVGQRPYHASPLEHQGYPAPQASATSGNLKGWRQWRQEAL